MVIKRFTNILGSKRSSTNPFRFGSSDNAAASGSNEDDIVETPDTPEGNVGRGVVCSPSCHTVWREEMLIRHNRDYSASPVVRTML